MQRALIASSFYFLILFSLGFVLGTIRVLWVAPRFGVLTATIAEVPIMLTGAFFLCRWAIGRWQVPRSLAIRWSMVLWFLGLLLLFEALLGALLFGRTFSQQWTALTTSAGLLGLSAQIISALFLLFAGKGKQA
jgi:hypothetical protein